MAGKTSIHFVADRENIQVLKKMLLSPDQFCMRGFEKLKYSQLVQNFGKIVMEGHNSRVRSAQRLGRVEKRGWRKTVGTRKQMSSCNGSAGPAVSDGKMERRQDMVKERGL